MNDIRVEYKSWLINTACDLMSQYGSYQKLFEYLSERVFYSKILQDGNREADGKDLRYRFTEQSNGLYTYRDVYLYLDFPVSVLEVILALALRIEEHIMGDLNAEDRTSFWLYSMIESIGLSGMDDNHFYLIEADRAIDILLDRAYQRNGRGGLFTVNNPSIDMRKHEIWYQMCWYLEEIN